MILNALVQPDLAPSAALAFRDVCGECSEQLSPLVVQLIPACQVREEDDGDVKARMGTGVEYIQWNPSNRDSPEIEEAFR